MSDQNPLFESMFVFACLPLHSCCPGHRASKPIRKSVQNTKMATDTLAPTPKVSAFDNDDEFEDFPAAGLLI
jgi:hypothetical protein